MTTYDFQQPSSDDSATAADDRRRSARIPQAIPAWISGESVERGSRGRNVVVGDLSVHGCGFRDADQPYRIGATHWLIVNGVMRLSTRVKIVSCRENIDGGYEVGAAFF